MTRALPLTQRQAQAYLRAAEAEGGIVEVKVGETVIRGVQLNVLYACKKCYGSHPNGEPKHA